MFWVCLYDDVCDFCVGWCDDVIGVEYVFGD